jgi:hypothetical protein
VSINKESLGPIQTEYENNPDLKHSTTLKRFQKYQAMLKKAKETILQTVQDITNFELWSSSGIGCSVCNSYYHSRFNLTGGDSMYFMDREYCTNFFNNSANYLNFSYYMYLIQHNINVVLRFVRTTTLVKPMINARQSANFMKYNQIGLDKWQNVFYIYSAGVLFGVENSLDKQKSLDSKINNCITDMNHKIFRDDCKEICLSSMQPNLVSIGKGQFVINMFFSEYLIDYYLSSFFTKSFVDISDWSSHIMQQDPEKEIKEEDTPTIPLKRLKKFKGSVKIGRLSEDVNVVTFFYKKMLDYQITKVFTSMKSSQDNTTVNNYIDFTELPSKSTDYKVGWSPFPNTMSYSRTRISYDSGSSQSILSLVATALFMKLMT